LSAPFNVPSNYFNNQLPNIRSNNIYKNSLYPVSKEYLNSLDFSKDNQNKVPLQNAKFFSGPQFLR
jgi:hypothetical protein